MDSGLLVDILENLRSPSDLSDIYDFFSKEVILEYGNFHIKSFPDELKNGLFGYTVDFKNVKVDKLIEIVKENRK